MAAHRRDSRTADPSTREGRSRATLASLVCMALSVSSGDAGASNCNGTSVGTIPLSELLSGDYQGFPGGLYAGVTNARPAAHETAGLAQAAQVVPRDATGAPNAQNGKIGLVTIGMSNTQSESIKFIEQTFHDPLRDPRLILVQGAAGGQVAERIIDPEAPYWDFVDQAVANAGLSPNQVQVFWLKEANPGPDEPFPEHAEILRNQLRIIVQILRDKFPNGRLCYLSSRIYAGYASTGLNPEPYAYESGFTVRWLIEQQMEGDPALNFDPAAGSVEAPWLSWAAYLWGDGLVPRSDGLIWECSDFADDGTHPSPQGASKVADLLMEWIYNDSTTRWYFAEPSSVDPLPERIGTLVPFPNPFSRSVRVMLQEPGAVPVLDRGLVYDLQGRRVRALDPAASGALEWDGRTDAGGLAASGSYVIQYWSAAEGAGSARVLLLR